MAAVKPTTLTISAGERVDIRGIPSSITSITVKAGGVLFGSQQQPVEPPPQIKIFRAEVGARVQPELEEALRSQTANKAAPVPKGAPVDLSEDDLDTIDDVTPPAKG